jgi:hypothetical protein
MKFPKNLKLASILLISITSVILAAKSEMETDITMETQDCDNPCLSCQKTVYQLKFQKLADCGDGNCRNTCFRIKESWNNPNSMWDPFLHDVFGKCEICFRAGFCRISECDAQKENEAKIVDEIVANSKLNPKSTDFKSQFGVQALDGDPMFYDPEKMRKIDDNISKCKRRIKESLDGTNAAGNAKQTAAIVSETVKDFFEKPFHAAGVDKAANFVPTENDAVCDAVEAFKTYVNHTNNVISLDKGVNLTKEQRGRYHELLDSTTKHVKENLAKAKSISVSSEKKKSRHSSELKNVVTELQKLDKSLARKRRRFR